MMVHTYRMTEFYLASLEWAGKTVGTLLHPWWFFRKFCTLRTLLLLFITIMDRLDVVVQVIEADEALCALFAGLESPVHQNLTAGSYAFRDRTNMVMLSDVNAEKSHVFELSQAQLAYLSSTVPPFVRFQCSFIRKVSDTCTASFPAMVVLHMVIQCVLAIEQIVTVEAFLDDGEFERALSLVYATHVSIVITEGAQPHFTDDAPDARIVSQYSVVGALLSVTVEHLAGSTDVQRDFVDSLPCLQVVVYRHCLDLRVCLVQLDAHKCLVVLSVMLMVLLHAPGHLVADVALARRLVLLLHMVDVILLLAEHRTTPAALEIHPSRDLFLQGDAARSWIIFAGWGLRVFLVMVHGAAHSMTDPPITGLTLEGSRMCCLHVLVKEALL